MSEMKVEVRESHLRSVLKGLTWRILATVVTVVIAYFVTGMVAVAFQIGAVEVVVKIVVYYAHERAWQLIPVTAKRTLKWSIGIAGVSLLTAGITLIATDVLPAPF